MKSNSSTARKIISALLLAVMILTTASCSDTPASESEDTNGAQDAVVTDAPEETTEEIITDDLPERDFEGHNFMIYSTNNEGNTWYTTVFTTAEEDSAEAIESGIYNRNLKVGERFNVTIKETLVTMNDITNSIMAGDSAFDIALIKGADALSLAQQKSLYDLKEMEYINLDKPYWDQNAKTQLTLANKLYIGIGDFMTTHIDETIVMFFNKALIGDYTLESPYDLIENDQWTLDKMFEMGQSVIQDLNGDSKFDDNDRFALLSWSGVGYPYMFLSSGEKYMSKNADDIPEIAFNTERFATMFEKVVTMMHSDNDTFFYDANVRQNTKGASNNHRVQEIMFPGNQALFWVECTSWAKALRDMDADFGIIPSPKFDEAQTRYYNYCNQNFFAMSIPVTSDVERTSIIAEALNSESTGTVLSAYYYITLKTKYSRDEQSQAMLDIIFDSRSYDIGNVYFDGSVNSAIYTRAANNNTDIASYYATVQKSLTKQIEKAIEKIS